MRKARIVTLLATVALVGTMAMPASATGNEGCTPGFWKTHPEAWQEYSPGDNILSSIGVSAGAVGLTSPVTFQQALEFGGGSGVTGGAKILLRAAAAAYLNAAADINDIDYPLHRSSSLEQPRPGIKQFVEAAWGDRAKMLEVATMLDGYNNLGAPNYC